MIQTIFTRVPPTHQPTHTKEIAIPPSHHRIKFDNYTVVLSISSFETKNPNLKS